MLTPQNEKVPVPPDHVVTIYHPVTEPDLCHTRGGTLIANLGTASDEFKEELTRISDEIEKRVPLGEALQRETPTPILLATDARRVSDLFAPNDVAVGRLAGLVLWVVDAGSAPLWLRDPEPIRSAIRRVAAHRIHGKPMTQLVVLKLESLVIGNRESLGAGKPMSDAPPTRAIELARLLHDAGASVAAVPDDGGYFVEVCRPDCVIGALHTASLPEDDAATAEAIGTSAPREFYCVARAPRLRRLTLAAIDEPSEATRRRLFEELLSREIALLMMADRGGRIHQRSWEADVAALPVFPDLSSAWRAAEDLELASDAICWGLYPPRNLFGWADQLPTHGIALNAYRDRKHPVYFFVSKDEIAALANGRVPGAQAGAD